MARNILKAEGVQTGINIVEVDYELLHESKEIEYKEGRIKANSIRIFLESANFPIPTVRGRPNNKLSNNTKAYTKNQ